MFNILLAVIVLLAGVTGTLGATAKPARPLVFIPGILGCQLIDGQNNIIWGDAASFRHFTDLEISEKGPVKDLRAGPLIQKVSVLGPFWAMHQYDILLSTLHGLGFREEENLFIFEYDWRYSNFTNALKLRAFIESKPILRNSQFDVLAHSMGGLIARIYLQDSVAATHVKRLINMGVPSLGSMNALADMTSGWGGFENWMGGGISTIRRVIFSFPSIFELFPRYTGCCRLGTESKYSVFDPTSAAIWEKGDWIPPEHRTPARLRMFEQSLINARKLSEIVRRPLPEGIEETNIVGDRLATDYYLYVDPNNPSWQKWRFSRAKGDGTVPVWSAANSDDLTTSFPSFADHATIFSDQWVIEKLTFMLDKNSGPPQVRGPAFSASTKSGTSIYVELVEADLENMFVPAGQSSNLEVSIRLGESLPRRGDLVPVLICQGPDGTVSKPSVTETTSEADMNANVVRFSTAIRSSLPGEYSIRITIPGLGDIVRNLVAIPD